MLDVMESLDFFTGPSLSTKRNDFHFLPFSPFVQCVKIFWRHRFHETISSVLSKDGTAVLIESLDFPLGLIVVTEKPKSPLFQLFFEIEFFVASLLNCLRRHM